jgi:hypothetical protein
MTDETGIRVWGANSIPCYIYCVGGVKFRGEESGAMGAGRGSTGFQTTSELAISTCWPTGLPTGAPAKHVLYCSVAL